jgi:hypothetical protein
VGGYQLEMESFMVQWSDWQTHVARDELQPVWRR